MSRCPRSEVFDPETVGVYHCYNRIVRRSFLCGFDPLSGKDYAYRREWFYQRLKYLAEYFALDVLAYAILSNHFHLVLRNRPDLVEKMNDREVVRRWLMICPTARRRADGSVRPPKSSEIRAQLQQPGRVDQLRQQLSNPSWLMRLATQYMGTRCNAEDEMRGHFWESRFGMKRLLDEAAILSCLAYVDLNPQRAHLSDSLESYPYASIGERLRTLSDGAIDFSSWLAPIALKTETDRQPVRVVNRMTRQEIAQAASEQDAEPLGCLPMTLQDYAALLRWLSPSKQSRSGDDGKTQPQPSTAQSDSDAQAIALLQRMDLDPLQFAQLVHDFSRSFYTVAGCRQSIEREAARRGKRRLKAPGRAALTRRRPSALTA